MGAQVKTVLVAVLGLFLAVYLGYQLGEDSLALPLVFTGVCIVFAVYMLFVRSIQFEALILGFLVFGYIVGNRGFAQLSPSGQIPIYFGEIGMVGCLVLIVTRSIFTRGNLIPKHPLALPIMLFLVLGAVRLLFDVRQYKLVAIRDSAMVYYAVFFFIAYQIGLHERSRRFVTRTFLTGLLFAPPAFALQRFFPDVLQLLSVRGVPIIHQKGDFAGSFFALGMLNFHILAYRVRWEKICLVLSQVFFGLMIVTMVRASYLATAVAIIFFLIARRPKLLALQCATLAIGLVVFGLWTTSTDSGDRFTKALSDKVRSMTDVHGTKRYEMQDISAANNRFRLIWWKTVCDEALENSPWVGLGFGYDLAKTFLRVYWGPSNAGDPNIRSPHCFPVTVFGRLGFVGLALLCWIVFEMFRATYRSAIAARGRRADLRGFALWMSAVVLFVAANFGVVLEGPMGGIIFWSLLGLACSYQPREFAPAPAGAGVKQIIDRRQREPEPALALTSLPASRR